MRFKLMKITMASSMALLGMSLSLAAHAMPTSGSDAAQTRSSLVEASRKGDLAEVRRILGSKAKANPNSRNQWGYTALEYALQADSGLTGVEETDRLEIVRLLLDSGAYVTLPALTHARRLSGGYAELLETALTRQQKRCEGSEQANEYAKRYGKLEKVRDKSFDDLSLMTDLQWKLEDVGCAVLIRPSDATNVASNSTN